MPRRTGRLRRLGLRLALLALAIQAAIPFLLAFELHAYAAAEDAAVIDSSLCLHDGSTTPSDPQHHDCNLTGCPLCTALAASHVLAIVGQGGPGLLQTQLAAIPRLAEERIAARALFSRAYRSRAPPLL